MKCKIVSCAILLDCLMLQATAVTAATGNTDVTGTIPLVTSEVSASNIGYYSATISWKTNGNATSQVFYDTVYHDNVTDYAYHTTEAPSLVSNHSITLTGLSSATTYHFRVKSVIPGTEFIAISDDYTFTTLTPYYIDGGGGGGWLPTPPLPPGTTDVSGVVTSQGRFTASVTATSADGLCKLTIPAGTVGLTAGLQPITQISITPMTMPPAPPAEADIIGLAYDLGPAGATFDTPITITFTYDSAKIPAGVAEENLVIAFWDGSKWVGLTDIVVEPAKNTISGKTSHLTPFAILAIAAPAPAAFSLSNLLVKPTKVQPNEPINITVSVANTGGGEGNYQVVLKINGVIEATKEVTVNAGFSKEVTFTISKDAPGVYSVDVNGLAGSFVVEEKTEMPPKPVNWLLIGGIMAAAIAVGLVIYYLVKPKKPKDKAAHRRSPP